MEWITDNWQWITLGLFIADKVVTITPTSADDLVLTAIRAAANTVSATLKPRKPKGAA